MSKLRCTSKVKLLKVCTERTGSEVFPKKSTAGNQSLYSRTATRTDLEVGYCSRFVLITHRPETGNKRNFCWRHWCNLPYWLSYIWISLFKFFLLIGFFGRFYLCHWICAKTKRKFPSSKTFDSHVSFTFYGDGINVLV